MASQKILGRNELILERKTVFVSGLTIEGSLGYSNLIPVKRSKNS